MTDTERIDKLESLLWSEQVGNGVALFPCVNNFSKERGISIDDLGDEDGSSMGESLTPTCKTLRAAIDLLCKA